MATEEANLAGVPEVQGQKKSPGACATGDKVAIN